MKLDVDREQTDKKEERLDISIKEFKEMYKTSKKNINVVNKQLETLKEILDDERIKHLEKEYEKLQDLETQKDNLFKEADKIQSIQASLKNLNNNLDDTKKEIEILDRNGVNLAKHFEVFFNDTISLKKSIKNIFLLSLSSFIFFMSSAVFIYYSKNNYQQAIEARSIFNDIEENRDLIYENKESIILILKELR